MIPVKLSIKGLYSYTSEQTIEFGPLIDAGLFGIFGAVGCGKSSILEAMTFVLYRNVERISINRNFNMMNLNSDELNIDFEFLAGANESEHYRFTVNGKRNRKHFEQVPAYKYAHYRLQDGDWIPDETLTAETILGLSYDNFRKTVIIPQGKFQDFLTLTSTERTTMLQEIFHLNRFDLSSRTTSLVSAAKLDLEGIRGRLSGFDEVDSAAIDTMKTTQTDKEKLLKNVIDEIALAEKEKERMDTIMGIVSQIKSAEARLDELKSRKPAFDKRAKALAQFSHARNNFADLLDSRAESNRSIAQREKSIEDGKLAVEFNKRKQADLTARFTAKLEKQFNIEIGENKSFDEAIKVAIDSLKNDSDTYSAKIKALESKLAPTGTLSAIKAWFVGGDVLSDKLTGCESRIEALSAKKTDIENHIEKVNIDITSHFDGKSAEDATANIEAQIQLLEGKIAQLTLNQGLLSYAEELKDGAPCPLCGATEHPKMYSSVESEGELHEARTEIERLRNVTTEITILSKELASHEKQRDSILADIANELKTKTAIEKDLNEHRASYIWEQNFRDKDALNTAIELETKLDTELKALRAEKNFQLSKRDELDALAEETKKDDTSLTQAITALSAKLESDEKTLSEDREKLSELNRTLEVRLSSSGFSSVDDVESALTLNINIAKETDEIKSFDESLHATTHLLETLKAEAGESTITQDEYNRLLSSLNEQKAKRDNLLGEVSNLKSEIARLTSRIKEKKTLTKHMGHLEARLSGLSELSSLFRKRGFVEYVSSIFLRNLISASNERFSRFCNGQFTLCLNKENDIEVIDRLCGGKRRSVKTLSGGQTFQAALALALSLAGSIQSNAHAGRNFFFMDEGFGSQDEESLALVMDTLKSLRKENRVVGVISHVDALKSEIPVHIRVERDIEHGSRVYLGED